MGHLEERCDHSLQEADYATRIIQAGSDGALEINQTQCNQKALFEQTLESAFGKRKEIRCGLVKVLPAKGDDVLRQAEREQSPESFN